MFRNKKLSTRWSC